MGGGCEGGEKEGRDPGVENKEDEKGTKQEERRDEEDGDPNTQEN